MSDVQTAPDPHAANTSDDNLTHDVCEHDLDTALCGSDVTDAPLVDNDDDQCIVCADLAAYYDRLGICCRIGEGADRG